MHKNPGPAIFWRSSSYPSRYNGQVPSEIRMIRDVSSLFPFVKPGFFVKCGQAYATYVNSHGAVSAHLENGELLGLKAEEFQVTSFHPAAAFVLGAPHG